jgi:membrane associated rhomboid family serine protease
MTDPRFVRSRAHQPAFNLPGVVLALLIALVAVHVVRTYLLSRNADLETLLAFAFIPARVIDPNVFGVALPGGEGARLWSFVTYAFLHADWSHLIFNGLWLAAFGSAVAVRFGPTRFLIYSAAGAVGGAALHLAIYPASTAPLIGASAAISAHMAGAARFVFAAGGPFVGFHRGYPAGYWSPVPPLATTLRDRRVLTFLAVWFVLNILFGLFGQDSGLSSGVIAWEAHIGGFVTGLLLFSVLDPVHAPHR